MKAPADVRLYVVTLGDHSPPAGPRGGAHGDADSLLNKTTKQLYRRKRQTKTPESAAVSHMRAFF